MAREKFLVYLSSLWINGSCSPMPNTEFTGRCWSSDCSKLRATLVGSHTSTELPVTHRVPPARVQLAWFSAVRYKKKLPLIRNWQLCMVCDLKLRIVRTALGLLFNIRLRAFTSSRMCLKIHCWFVGKTVDPATVYCCTHMLWSVQPVDQNFVYAFVIFIGRRIPLRKSVLFDCGPDLCLAV